LLSNLKFNSTSENHRMSLLKTP